MKDAIDSVPAERPVESDSFANRKLIRPSLNHSDHHHPQPSMHAQPSMMERRDRPERSDRSERNERNDRGGAGRKGAPPEQTNAENFYYQKQMQSKTAMVIVLRDGEEIRGTIEWYDKTCLKVNRNSQPNLMIYKPSIKYMYKEGENSRK
jgi:host factor-I protein